MSKIDRTYLYKVSRGLALVTIAASLGFGCMSSSVDSKRVQASNRDMTEIQASDTLRIITRNHPLTYYLYRGTRRGFEYELIKKFAQEKGLHLEVVVPPTWNDMIAYLQEGKGDVIASTMSITPERTKQVAFTRPYLEVRQVAVGTREFPPPTTPEEFEGKWVTIRKGTSYEENLQRMQDSGIDLNIESMTIPLTDSDPIERVALGDRNLTVVDNITARLEQNFYPELEIGCPVSEPEKVAWAVRPEATELLDELNEFLDRYYRSAYFNILKKRYFETPDRFRRHREVQLATHREGHISNFDELFRQAADEAGFDWRLLAALSYHESRFKPDMQSWAGAVGLMQLMPIAARAVGIDDIHDNEQNTLGGALFLRILYDHYKFANSEADRYSLALAAYNAGQGHIGDAIEFARSIGLDPGSWEELKQVLPMFEDPDTYDGFEHGFFRGRMVRQYVYDVMNRYNVYKELVPEYVPLENQGIIAESELLFTDCIL